MATVTDRILTLGESFLEVTYDDVTLNLVLVRVVVVEPITVLIKRGNGVNWQERTLQPGETVFSPGGPVRNLADIPHIGASTVA